MDFLTCPAFLKCNPGLTSMLINLSCHDADQIITMKFKFLNFKDIKGHKLLTEKGKSNLKDNNNGGNILLDKIFRIDWMSFCYVGIKGGETCFGSSSGFHFGGKQ